MAAHQRAQRTALAQPKNGPVAQFSSTSLEGLLRFVCPPVTVCSHPERQEEADHVSAGFTLRRYNTDISQGLHTSSLSVALLKPTLSRDF